MLLNGNEHVNVKAAAADFPFALDLDIESKNLGYGLYLAFKSMIIPVI